MRQFIHFMFIIMAITLLGYICWPFLHPYLIELKSTLIAFKKFCKAFPILSYLLYGLLFGIILFIGLPLATGVMLFAGVTYSFWEAATLITICRLVVAVVVFMLARYLIQTPQHPKRRPYIIRRLERHPNIGLFVARVLPIPDSIVNVATAASPISNREYVVVSLLGMIPFTLFCVWLGHQFGTVTKLLAVLS